MRKKSVSFLILVFILNLLICTTSGQGLLIDFEPPVFSNNVITQLGPFEIHSRDYFMDPPHGWKLDSDQLSNFIDILNHQLDFYSTRGFKVPPETLDPKWLIWICNIDDRIFPVENRLEIPHALTSLEEGLRWLLLDSYFLGNDFYSTTPNSLGEYYRQITELDKEVVPAHELFHIIQLQYNMPTYGWVDGDGIVHNIYSIPSWVLEGQARAIQDKIQPVEPVDPTENPIEIDDANTDYDGGFIAEINSYLGNPFRNLKHMTYDSVLFWTYIMEQYGSNADPGEQGIDFLANYWSKAEALRTAYDDAAIDDALPSGVTFQDVFCDFIVANYAKDLVGIRSEYAYPDQSQVTYLWDPVHIPIDVTPLTMEPLEKLGENGLKIEAWCPNYTRYNCDNINTNYYNIKVSVVTSDYYTNYEPEEPPNWPSDLDWSTQKDELNVELFLDFLLINQNEEIIMEDRKIGFELERTVWADVQIDDITVIVGGLDDIQYAPSVYDLTITPINQIDLNIINPTSVDSAYVGDYDSPYKFVVDVEVEDSGNPLDGLVLDDFDVLVGSQTADVISCMFVDGHWQLEVLAPTQTTPYEVDELYDLTVNLFDLTITEADCVKYADINYDSIIVIDHSGSMRSQNKIDAAQNSAGAYINSFLYPILLGLVQFNESAQLLQPLGDLFVDPFRDDILGLIEGTSARGWTSIGDGLLVAQNELSENYNEDHQMHILLLTDGWENDPFWIEDVQDLLINNGTILDVVAIGENAQIADLQWLAGQTNGVFEYVPEPTSGTLNTELASVYRSFAENLGGQSRIYSSRKGTWDMGTIQDSFVIGMASDATVVVSYKNSNSLISTPPLLELPDLSVIPPNFSREHQAFEGDEYYYGHFVWQLQNPLSGDYNVTLVGSGDIEYYCEVGVKSPISFKLLTDFWLVTREVGEPIPVAISLSDDSAIVGAEVIAEITAAINYDDTQTWELHLYDDGNHGDGRPNDGIYGNDFTRTTGLGLDLHNETGVTFSVCVKANGTSSLAASFKGGGFSNGEFTRETTSAFHLVKPVDWDEDGDGLPDIWEELHGLNSSSSVGKDGWDGDPDADLLYNYQELSAGTSPTDSDTDRGGESDYSEVQFGRDPFFKEDDYFFNTTLLTGEIPHCVPIVSDNHVTLIYYISHIDSDLTFNIYKSERPDRDFSLLVAGLSGNDGSYIDGAVTNDQLYFYRIAAIAPSGERTGYSTIAYAKPEENSTPPLDIIRILADSTTTHTGTTGGLDTETILIIAGAVGGAIVIVVVVYQMRKRV